jgi:hypothetical protein
MVWKRALDKWEKNWQTAKSHLMQYGLLQNSLTEMGGPDAPSTIHGPLGPIFCPIDEVNIIADWSENKFRAHDLYDCDHKQVEAVVEALPATVDKYIPVNFRPYDV